MDGRHVEVTFLSAWQRVPEEMPLDQPFWPDISTRYDEFFVAAYVPIELAASTPAGRVAAARALPHAHR